MSFKKWGICSVPLVVKKSRPVIFNSAMVRAVLAGRKTQFRRIIDPQPQQDGTIHGMPAWRWDHPRVTDCGYCHTNICALQRLMASCCLFKRKTRLWVREAWDYFGGDEYLYQRERSAVYYQADDNHWRDLPKWRPSVHMPRWASRITLEITGVSVQRLMEISDRDAQQEGVTAIPNPDYDDEDPCDDLDFSHVAAFAHLWDKHYARRGYPFESSPFVWCLEFKRVEATQ